jgi:hypothetical protein
VFTTRTLGGRVGMSLGGVLGQMWAATPCLCLGGARVADRLCVSAIKPYEGFGDVDHTIKELMSL